MQNDANQKPQNQTTDLAKQWAVALEVIKRASPLFKSLAGK